MTLQQCLKAAQNIKRMRQVHEYYMATPGCTMKQAALFTDQTMSMVVKYYAIRKECQSVISAVIDTRYWHRGAQDEKEV